MMTPPKHCLNCPVFALSIFHGLDESKLDLIANTKTAVSIKARENVIKQGQKSSDIYCIFSGLTKVYSDDGAKREHIITITGRGDSMGVVSAVDDKNSLTSFEALTDIQACHVPKETIQTLMTDIRFSKSIIEYLLGILYRHINPTRRGARFSVKERMARVLVDFAKRFGEETEAGTQIMVPLSRKELASLAETVNETAVRTLGELKSEGLITTKAHHIYIRDIEKLEALTQAPPEL